MSELIALLLWLTGNPPSEPTPNDNPTAERLGGGIPVQPGSSADK